MYNPLLKQVIEEGLKEKGLWYFGHPYTCYDQIAQKYLIQEANFQICIQRTIKLVEEGWTIFSPIIHSHPIQSNSVGLLRHSNRDDIDLHRFMMAIDLTILHRTDFCGLILAPEWENSNGCNQEHDFFLERDKPILYYKDLVIFDV